MSPDLVAVQIELAWAERLQERQPRPDEMDAEQVLAGLNDEDANVHRKTIWE